MIMSANTTKGPVIDPGMCRCCGAAKKCRLLNVEYEWCGQKEIYSDMFFDCFGHLLSHLDGELDERLICASCVVRLRDAIHFRRQVLRCEEMLLKAKLHADYSEPEPKDQIKKETHVSNEIHDSDHIDDCTDDAGKLENETAQIKEEKLNTIVTRKAKLSIKLNSAKKIANKEEVTARKEMLRKIKKMKDKLLVMKTTDKLTKRPLLTLVKKKYIDKEQNALENAIAIIENSYVCPFITIYSDYYCIYCKEMFTDVDVLREHTLTHDVATYKDVVCQNNKKNLLIDISRIDCRSCETTIDNVDALKEHISEAHGKFVHKEAGNEFLQFKLKTGNMTCTECNRSFNYFQALRKHMALHFGSCICDICGAHYFEERLLIFHKKQAHKSGDEEVKIYTCGDCGKTFKSKKGRFLHVARIHKNEPAYPCNRCDDVFLSYHKRYKHKIETHGELRIFPCETCDKVYNSRKTLREHIRKHHLLLLRHECSECDRKFYLPSQLKDHMTSHTGERNFRCEYCGKSYPRLKALKVHMESHNAEKKYKCALCTAAYTQLNNYKNHMKSKHSVGSNDNNQYV